MEWLRTVEVGRNNRYVAEAASSKFLTGKRSHPATTTTSVNGSGAGNMTTSGDGLGSGLIKGYPMGKRVHSDGAAVAPKTTYLKGKKSVPGLTAPAKSADPYVPPKPTVTAGRTAPSGTGSAATTTRKQVMGRSMNMFHGPATAVRRSGRGTKTASRPRASAVMR